MSATAAAPGVSSGSSTGLILEQHAVLPVIARAVHDEEAEERSSSCRAGYSRYGPAAGAFPPAQLQ
jgi:hypothetical protein